jgi:hypothetical protein
MVFIAKISLSRVETFSEGARPAQKQELDTSRFMCKIMCTELQEKNR